VQRRILVVDDDKSIREVLADRFRAMGFMVVTAADGQMGLEIVRSSWIDGILLDFEMPVMDGVSMLQGLRKWHWHIPVLMMSADHNPEKVEKAIALGAIGFVPKPIDFALLSQQCSRLFE
jgi:two-component system chemotaxis response regulator CheY